MEDWIGERKTGRGEGRLPRIIQGMKSEATPITFQERYWGQAQSPDGLTTRGENILSSNGTVLAWNEGFPAPSQQVSETG